MEVTCLNVNAFGWSGETSLNITQLMDKRSLQIKRVWTEPEPIFGKTPP